MFNACARLDGGHDKGAGEEHHEPICGGQRQEGTVTGTVHQRDGKNYIKPNKVEYAKK